MKRKITIDLVSDTTLDLSIEEHEALLQLVKFSLTAKRKQEKKKPSEETLFGVLEKPEKANTTFANSKANDWEFFKSKLKEEEELGVDVFYYYNCVKDWSLINPKKFRTSVGWIATARTFMRNEKNSGKLKMTVAGKGKMSDEEALEYLNT